MLDIEVGRVQEINQLHQEIGGYLKITLDKAIRVGELLQEQKAGLKHGEWLPWVEENCSFSERLARDYMRFYDRREDLKTASLADLTGARKLLADNAAHLRDAEGRINIDELIESLGIEPHNEIWDFQRMGIVFKKSPKPDELTMLLEHLSFLSLPGDHQYFFIGDCLAEGEKCLKRAEQFMQDEAKNTGLTKEKIFAVVESKPTL